MNLCISQHRRHSAHEKRWHLVLHWSRGALVAQNTCRLEGWAGREVLGRPVAEQAGREGGAEQAGRAGASREGWWLHWRAGWQPRHRGKDRGTRRHSGQGPTKTSEELGKLKALDQAMPGGLRNNNPAQEGVRAKNILAQDQVQEV